MSTKAHLLNNSYARCKLPDKSYNGQAQQPGTATDTAGMQVASYVVADKQSYWNGVFYKMIFHDATMNQLSINMLLNLFERDDIIDMTHPVFITV